MRTETRPINQATTADSQARNAAIYETSQATMQIGSYPFPKKRATKLRPDLIPRRRRARRKCGASASRPRKGGESIWPSALSPLRKDEKKKQLEGSVVHFRPSVHTVDRAFSTKTPSPRHYPGKYPNTNKKKQGFGRILPGKLPGDGLGGNKAGTCQIFTRRASSQSSAA